MRKPTYYYIEDEGRYYKRIPPLKAWAYTVLGLVIFSLLPALVEWVCA